MLKWECVKLTTQCDEVSNTKYRDTSTMKNDDDDGETLFFTINSKSVSLNKETSSFKKSLRWYYSSQVN